ncbi:MULTISPECIES: ATP-dependent helicase [Alphaproteobacteria]|uniref:ATP-dependent helicase n=1 Tax=Alphaproteobacteria TaxID=28211 RepID=UPI003299DE10
MTFRTCPDRDKILAADGHVVVTGGPGCGKTTVALRKALLRIEKGLQPGQKVLFLSFSRAAVARIVQTAKTDLPKETRQHLEIQTFHSFCWQIVRGHGYLLGAPSPIRLMSPQDERAMRNGAQNEDPAWDTESERLFLEEGRLTFDLFASKALGILQRSDVYRRLIAGCYPLIIVDEAQDTGTAQWACVEALQALTQLVCLADLDQQIYEFRRDVSPERLKQIIATLKPLEIDLGDQNNRSPTAEIVSFGNDILAGTPRGSAYEGVGQLNFRPETAKRDEAIRKAVVILYREIKKATGSPPASIGYLTNWGKGVSVIARALQGGDGARPIRHRVLMDEAEVLLATRVVALCLEPVTDVWDHLATGLELVSELYRAKGKTNKVTQLLKNAADARNAKLRGNAKCPRVLKTIFEELQANPLSGSPSQDWLTIRGKFEASEVTELEEIAKLVVYLMVFNRGRRISDSLAEVWLRRGSYEGARALIEAAITEDQIVGGDNDLTGINVMTMHKSKGKEFDGVILLHLGHISPFCPENEAAPNAKSRRLLRVGITRAKHRVMLLTDVYSPSPLLAGHKLNQKVVGK